MPSHHHTIRIHIAKPVEAVFGAVADANTHPQWMSQLIRTEISDPPPLKVGTRVEDVMRMFGREMRGTFEVTKVDPPHAIGIRAISGPIRPINHMTFSSENDGTLLESETTIPGLMGVLMGRMVTSQQQRNLQTLKELLEAGKL
jgi:uncharacterized protein YndB with AHSA1/START domain